jgi:hypothetical protein
MTVNTIRDLKPLPKTPEKSGRGKHGIPLDPKEHNTNTTTDKNDNVNK